jgi:hypothetical protein
MANVKPRIVSFRAALAFSCACVLVACGGGGDEDAAPAPNPPQATLVSIALTPANSTVQMGATLQLTATGTYSDNSTQNVTVNASWSSSNTTAATVNDAAQKGMVSGAAAGNTTITATVTGISGNTGVTVTAQPATLTSVSVSPASANVVAGLTTDLEATATYSNNTTDTVTDTAAWSSTATSIATVNDTNAKGRVTAVAVGTTTIEARFGGMTGSALVTVTTPSSAPNLLRRSPTNGRYFENGAGNIVVLTGSHTWSNLQDNGGSNPPPAFDYEAWLNFLSQHGHNFFRLWSWEQSRWTVETSDNNYWFSPLPYERTGPGMAIDGLPRFDLTRLNQAYFDRLRDRVVRAGQRNMYVAIVLFDGWSVAADKGGHSAQNPWRGHPFNASNNINSVNGDPGGNNSGEETHELQVTAVTNAQRAYVTKVIQTVNDLDNVLYEISNESHSAATAWQSSMVNFIKSTEATMAKQHPVGMTVEYPNGTNSELLSSPADWVSLNGDIDNPPSANGTKVIIADTDHLCGICGNRQWVWKSFTRGENPIFMDGYDGAGYGVGGDGFDMNNATWVSLRRNLGYVLQVAQSFDLKPMTPRNSLASSSFCLADPASGQFIVYLESGTSVTVNLTGVSGSLRVEWLNTSNGTRTAAANQAGGSSGVVFTKPGAVTSSDTVLLLRP